MRLLRSVILILGLSIFLTVNGADRAFESRPEKTHLLELFTSEGCSSCPPAEAWLSKLKADPGLWKDFVPIAFHVDYWDRLGWKDPFAAKDWTARQYRYTETWKSESVYTPGFVLDGRELRNRAVPSASSEKPGVLKITISKEKAVAEFHPSENKGDRFDLYFASLGFDLNTKVNAGENNGRNLHHDFVVLSLTNKKLVDGQAQLEMTNADARSEAIAAWVTKADQLEPIQAVGGWVH